MIRENFLGYPFEIAEPTLYPKLHQSLKDKIVVLFVSYTAQ